MRLNWVESFFCFPYRISHVGNFPLSFLWSFSMNQTPLQYFNPKESESYVFPVFHLHSKGAKKY